MKSTAAQRVAENVRAELARRGKTRGDLRPVLGLSYTAVQRRISGEIPLDVEEVEKIARYLDVPISALMEGPALAGSERKEAAS